MFTSFTWVQAGNALWDAFLYLVCNPLLYVGTVLMAVDLSRNAKAERQYFGIRLTKVARPLLLRFLSAVVAGLIVSALLLLVGVVVQPWEVFAMTALSLVLGAVRLRFMALYYAIGAMLLARLATNVWEPGPGALHRVWASLHGFNVAGWLAVAAAASLLNGVLLWIYRGNGAPTAMMNRRGGTIGAFLVQLAFCAPLVIPTHGTTLPPSSSGLFHGWPWLGTTGGGVTLLALPILIGYSGIFSTTRPADGLKPIVLFHLTSAVVFAVIAYYGRSFPMGSAVAGVGVLVVAYELLLWGITRRQVMGDPLFIESPQGVRILAAVKGSLADVMGLQPGEVITHVNQVPVHSTYDLHFALEQNPAYAKLQVLDLRGEVRFVGKPVYAGERHHLGIIFTPDTTERVGNHWVKSGFLQTLYLNRDIAATRGSTYGEDENTIAPSGR